MSALLDPGLSVSPLVVAALLLAARDFQRKLDFPHSTADEIIEATGATRSRVYEVKRELLGELSKLHRAPGRPAKQKPAPAAEDTVELLRAMLSFVMAHPGCVSGGAVRRHYTDELRVFVVELRSRYPQVTTDAFAAAVALPPGTVADWLRAASSAEDALCAAATAAAAGGQPDRCDATHPGATDDEPHQLSAVDGRAEPDTARSGGTEDEPTRQPDAADHGPERQPDTTPAVAEAAAPPPSVADERPQDRGQADQRPEQLPNDGADAAQEAQQSAHVATIIDNWKRWQGGFVDFCDHVQQQWRVPFGRTLIASILEGYGVRLPRRRPGRSPDEEALRHSFETFFGGAQWVGDGSPIEVVIDGEVITLNLELMVDAHSAAVAGESVRKEEDGAAVIEAFADAVTTTGQPPLAVLLDNKPCNHTPEVDAALGETMRIRATVGRPQNKAHAEGAFGLFQQTVPPLELTTDDPLETAMELLKLIVVTWARTINHRPRRDRKGRSRVDLYGDKPSAEQIAKARAALEERCRRQELARQTVEARQDPLVRQTLDEAFRDLDLSDPERYFRNAIARYPLDAILAAIATFRGKRDAGTLPDGVDARYLLGIARNITSKREGLAIADALLRERIAARDRALVSLQRELHDVHSVTTNPHDRIASIIDLSLDSARRIDQLFWLNAAADVIVASDNGRALYATAARRIHAAFRVTYAQRLEAVEILAATVVAIT